MPYQDFRQFLDVLRQQGELIDIDRPIALTDVGKALKQAYQKGRPAVCFNDNGTEFPLVCGVYSDRNKALLAFQADEKTILQKVLDGLEKTKLDEAQKNEIRQSVSQAFLELRKIAPPNYAWQNPPKWPFYVENGKPSWQDGVKEWLSKLLGWLLTALATSLGAQFWFNIMSEALKLRAAGRKPDDDSKKGQPKKKDQVVAGGGTDAPTG